MRSSRILVADAGAAHAARAQFASAADGRLVLQQFAIERLNPDPALEASWSSQTAAAFATIAGRASASGALVLAVPGHLALTKFIKTPAIEKSKRSKIILFEASQNIPYPLEEVVWDHVVVADDGMDLEVMLMAVKADAMHALCDAAQTGGLAVARALPSCVALRRAFCFNYPECDASVLLVSVGARSTHLLFHEPGRFFVRTLPLAGNTVTQAVADELHLEFAAAETLKVQVLSGRSELPESSPARAAVLKAAENFSGRLQLEITRSSVNLRRQATAAPPTAVYLAGGGSLFAALPQILAEKSKLPVHRFDPLRRVEVAPGAAAAKTAEHAPLLTDLVGLAASRASEDDAPANLLPPALGEALVTRRRQPVVLVAAALGAAALLPPIWHYHRLAVAAQTEIAALDTVVRPLRSLQNRNAENLAQIEQLRKQVEALHGLAETKSNWINFFTDLQGRLVKVEDVWLEKLSVVRSPGAGNAAAKADDVAPPPLRLTLSGRLLDKNNPVSKVSTDSYARVKRLLASFRGSHFIAVVENERFDNSQPGLLRFDFTLVVSPENPL